MPLDLTCRVTFLVYRDVRTKIRNHTSNFMYLSHQKFINNLCNLLLIVSIYKRNCFFAAKYIFICIFAYRLNLNM